LSYAGIRHVEAFKTVARFLVDVAEKEIKFGEKEAFIVWKNRAAAFKTQFLSEFKAYARHQYPFNLPVDEKNGALKWWKALIGLETAAILPVRRIFQLFDYNPHSSLPEAPRDQNLLRSRELNARRANCVNIYVVDTCFEISNVRFYDDSDDSNTAILQDRTEGE
jgi:hypothetical protein